MVALAFGTPRKLPKASRLQGQVVVLDVAFAGMVGGGFDKITKKFIDALGDRLAGWIDHHDHDRHIDYQDDDRFVLCTKADHGACPEMITPELVDRIGHVDTIVCHTDFDGLASAAKWELIFRATRDGADAETFHDLCDGKGPRTVTVAPPTASAIRMT